MNKHEKYEQLKNCGRDKNVVDSALQLVRVVFLDEILDLGEEIDFECF